MLEICLLKVLLNGHLKATGIGLFIPLFNSLFQWVFMLSISMLNLKLLYAPKGLLGLGKQRLIFTCRAPH